MTPEIVVAVTGVPALKAAVESGADAVCVPAAGLDLAGSARAAAWAHARGVRLYLALPPAVAEGRLEQVLAVLAAASAQKLDALVVEDLGVADMVRRALPALRLHGGPGLAVHTQGGLEEAGRRGFHRVALAGQLTAEEVCALAGAGGVEREVQVHGPQCLGVMGRCLLRALVAGGDAGVCTQACRGPFMVRGRIAYPFNTADLALTRHGEILRGVRAAAWRIELGGEPPAHVRAVVDAYRALRAGTCQRASIPVGHSARPVTAGFLGGGARVTGFTVPDVPGLSGTLVGRIARIRGGMAELRLRAALALGETLAFMDPDGAAPRDAPFVLRHMEAGGKRLKRAASNARVRVGVPRGVKAGDLVLREPSAARDANVMEGSAPPWEAQARRMERRLRATLRKTGGPPAAPAAPAGTVLTLETDDLAVARSAPRSVDGVLLVLTDRLMHRFTPSMRARLPAETGIALPPFILPERVPKVREALARYASWGISLVEVNDLGGWDLAPKGVRVQAGPLLRTHNRAAAQAHIARGAHRVVFPLDGDRATLEALCRAGFAPWLEVVLYAYVPLLVSRAGLSLKGGAELRDRRGERMTAHNRDGLTHIVGRRPLCLFSQRAAFCALGVRHFRITLTGRAFPAAGVAHLAAQYACARDVAGSAGLNLAPRLAGPRGSR